MWMWMWMTDDDGALQAGLLQAGLLQACRYMASRSASKLKAKTRQDKGQSKTSTRSEAMPQRYKRQAMSRQQDTKETSVRLAAQPELTRYVEEPATGARRYRPPRFAGPQY